MATKTPYMAFYPSDYLADTQDLSVTAHGAYLLLIMAYWQRRGPLPSDDAKLARIARATPDEWSSVKEDVLSFFVLSDGLWTHRRLDQDLQEAAEKSAKAKVSANDRWNKPDANAMRPHMPTQSDRNSPDDANAESGAMRTQCSSSSSSTIKKTHTPKPPVGDSVPVPDLPEKRTRHDDTALDRFVLAWNGARLPEYRRTPANWLTFPKAGEVAEALSYYSTDEIVAAIANYAELLKNPDRYRWGDATYGTVGAFLVKGVPKFAPGAFDALKKPGLNEPTQEPKKPMFCKYCGTPKGNAHYCLNLDCTRPAKALEAFVTNPHQEAS